MASVCFILFLLLSGLCFFASSYDGLFGVYGPTFMVRRRAFWSLVLPAMILGVCLALEGDVNYLIDEIFSGHSVDSRSLVIILLSSLIALGGLRYFAITGSFSYAVIGGLSAFFVTNGFGELLTFKYLLSIIVSPIVAFIFSFSIRKLLTVFFSKVSIHIITLSYYMRHAVIAAIVLTSVAFGLNWGGFLSGIGGATGALEPAIADVVIPSVIAIIMLLVIPFRNEGDDEPYGIFADFSIYAVVSVGLSIALTLIFFSFNLTTMSIGLYPVPLSAPILLMAAVAGVEVAQRNHMVDEREYLKSGFAFLATPIMSFLVSALLLTIVETSPEDRLMDFMVLSAALLAFLAISFASYVKGQSSQRDATDRLVSAQQQQIYENSRALNDMELKVILSENQALYNSIEMKRQEVMNVALSIVEQKEYLESISGIAKKLSVVQDPAERDQLISELNSSLKQRLSYERDVDSQYFYAQAEVLHEDFNAKLSENFPSLTQQERRLATLLRLGFSSKYIATLMNITPKSVEISRYRLRQKLGIAKGDNLVNFIKSI